MSSCAMPANLRRPWKGWSDRVQGAGCRVQGTGYRVQGAGYRVQGTRCRVDIIVPRRGAILIENV